MVSYSFDLSTLEYFLLILVRISTFVFVAPFYGNSAAPSRVKIGLSVFLSILLYGLVPTPTYSYNTELGYAVIVIKETLTGLLIGYSANICSAIVLLAGNLIDIDIGLSMAQTYDPSTGANVTLTGQLYNQILTLLFITSGMYQYLVQALVDSFTLIPIGGLVLDTDSFLVAVVEYATDIFTIAFRIMLPIFGVMLIMNTILAIIAKVAPQMNMFSVGIQIKVLMGLTTLFLTTFLVPEFADLIFNDVRTTLVSFVESMY